MLDGATDALSGLFSEVLVKPRDDSLPAYNWGGMDPKMVGPYIASHAAAVTYVLVAWRWPRVARWIAGLGFVVVGAFNLWMGFTSPQTYVQAFGPHAFPQYREFIYGAFARHTREFIVAIACGQICVGGLALAPVPWRRLAYAGAILFLLAITPLGIGSAAPSTLIFAAGLVLLSRERRVRPRGAPVFR